MRVTEALAVDVYQTRLIASLQKLRDLAIGRIGTRVMKRNENDGAGCPPPYLGRAAGPLVPVIPNDQVYRPPSVVQFAPDV